jgi:hypothetical protein
MTILRKLPVVAVLFASLLIVQKADAYFQSVNDLIPLMHEYVKADASQSGANYEDARVFRAYVQGVYDATEDDYDTPEGFGTRQLLAVVVKYIKENPQEWNLPAGLIVRKALRQAFLKK